MKAVHHAVPVNHLGEQRLRFGQRHDVRGLVALAGVPVFHVHVQFRVRLQILIERPAKLHVDELGSPADPEDGQMRMARPIQQFQLEIVPLAIHFNVVVFLFLFVKGGVHILAAGQEDPVVVFGVEIGRAGCDQVDFLGARARHHQSLEIRRVPPVRFLFIGN